MKYGNYLIIGADGQPVDFADNDCMALRKVAEYSILTRRNYFVRKVRLAELRMAKSILL